MPVSSVASQYACAVHDRHTRELISQFEPLMPCSALSASLGPWCSLGEASPEWSTTSPSLGPWCSLGEASPEWSTTSSSLELVGVEGVVEAVCLVDSTSWVGAVC